MFRNGAACLFARHIQRMKKKSTSATGFALCCFKKPHVSPKQFPSCMDKRGQRILPTNAIDVESNDVYKSRLEIICKYWFGGGPKTFSYITAIVGCVLLVGAFQFVVADWYLMIHEGDRDHCYYNDFCYRVRYLDIPYNLMLSNVVYIVHAVILTVSVLWMEAELFARCEKLAKALGNENSNTNDNTNARCARCGKLAIAEHRGSAESKGSPPPPDSSSVQATSQANPPPPNSSSVDVTSQANSPPPDSSSVEVTSQANSPPPDDVGKGNSDTNENTDASADSEDDIYHDAENGNTSSVTGGKGEGSSRNLKEDQREVEAQGVSAEREGSSPPPPKDSESALTVTV